MIFDNSKLTNKSRNAVNKAFALTRQCQFRAVEPQVMMVAVLQEGDDMVPFMLNNMDVDKNRFFSAVSDSIQQIPRTNLQAQELSQEMKNILDKANSLAARDRQSFTALEYLFWAFALVPNPIGQLMRQFGITPQKMQMAVHAFQNGNETGQGRTEHDASNLPFLHKYGMDMVRMAEENSIEPVIGRDEELRRILQILSRKTKNNPVLVGEPGTGKTAIVEGLAHRIAQGDVPLELRNVRLFSLNIASLIAGAQMQGEFEQRLKKVIEEATSNPDVILFIDEIHLIVGAGKTSGAMDAANILKPELARGVIKIIGSTTLDEYMKYIEKDKAFERRFQKVLVDEPDEETATTILRGIKQRFENHHHIKIMDDAVVSAVRLSHRYISDRFLPDKAIDLIDEAASAMRIDQSSVPHDLEMLRRQITNKEIEKESLIQDGNPETSPAINNLSREIADLKEKENVLNARWQNERQKLETIQNLTSELHDLESNRSEAERQGRYSEVVELQRKAERLRNQVEVLSNDDSDNENVMLKSALDERDIMKVVTAWTGIPMTSLTQDEGEKLLHIEESLHKTVIGQDKAVKAVSDAIRRNRMGLGDADHPIGTFLFLGSTGVGKTELSKALAEFLFNSRDMMVRIDMSEYQQEHSVARLFGAPPGYVGYDEGGQLTEAVRRRPYSVVLFDEIEKAHPKVFETLLQVLDDGRMTDGQGRVVDFKNTIIIMTSNMGQEVILNNLTHPNPSEELIRLASEQVVAKIKQRVAPEFLNRIDDIIMFLPLNIDAITQIVRIQLEALKNKLSKNEIHIEFDDKAVSLIAHRGYNPEYGGRPVKRAIKDLVTDVLTLKLLRQEVSKSLPIKVSGCKDEITISN